MERELHAVINPISGNGRTRRLWPALSRRLSQRGYQIHAHTTSGPRDATRIAQHLAQANSREILVVGGDGTLNEVVNGLLADESENRDTPVITLVPSGTGRDFSRSLGIRDADHAIELLDNGAICTVDVGVIRYQDNGATLSRHFINVADVGLGAETAAWINGSSKALGGFLTYLIGASRTILVFRGRPAQVIVDGSAIHDGPVGMVVLANGQFYAGGMLVAPMASVRDGQLEVLILHDVPKWQLLGSLLPRVYRGKHVGHPAVTHLRAREIEVVASNALPFEVDGEQPGTTNLQATILPGALRFRAPHCQI